MCFNITYLFELFIADIALVESIRSLSANNLVNSEQLLTFLCKKVGGLAKFQCLQVFKDARIYEV